MSLERAAPAATLRGHAESWSVDPLGHTERVEASRRRLLDSLGDGEVTFVRGLGNRGDELIWAGARRLLGARPWREIGIPEIGRASGEVAALSGGGAWCAPFHEVMPRVLPLLESRFTRVVVLPSSFDLSVPDVRRALERTRAHVFARESVSLAQIRDVCVSDLAHDTSFFFDYAPYRREGNGILNAFRRDRESADVVPLPGDNRDLSTEAESLDEWLWTIARSRRVRTDRAHVMIAAALLGKEVEYFPSSYHKVPALAEWALPGFPVSPLAPEELEKSEAREIEPAPAAPPRPVEPGAPPDILRRMKERAESLRDLLPDAVRLGTGEPRVTAVLLSWNRLQRTLAALDSLKNHVEIPIRILLVDNHSTPEVRERLTRYAAEHPAVELVLLDRNLGCAAGRRFGASRAATDYVFFLDDDAEVLPGALEHLLLTLERDSSALAAGAKILLPTGQVQHCGGDFEEEGGLLRFRQGDQGRAFDDETAGSSGPCRWLGATALLVRRAALETFPFETAMSTYFEDNEWSYRVERAAPGSLRRCAEALVVHHPSPKDRVGSRPIDLMRALPFAESIGRFYEAHGLVMADLYGFVPELTFASGAPDVSAGRLFLELLNARGAHWMLSEWLSGRLVPLFRRDVEAAAREAALEEARRARAPLEEALKDREALEAAAAELQRVRASRWWRLANRYWSLLDAVRRLAGRST